VKSAQLARPPSWPSKRLAKARRWRSERGNALVGATLPGRPAGRGLAQLGADETASAVVESSNTDTHRRGISGERRRSGTVQQRCALRVVDEMLFRLVGELHRVVLQLDVEEIGAEAVRMRLPTATCSAWRTTAGKSAEPATGKGEERVRVVRGTEEIFGEEVEAGRLIDGGESARKATGDTVDPSWGKVEIRGARRVLPRKECTWSFRGRRAPIWYGGRGGGVV
jgi:hypothetical protein